jgi:hypothetical protein
LAWTIFILFSTSTSFEGIGQFHDLRASESSILINYHLLLLPCFCFNLPSLSNFLWLWNPMRPLTRFKLDKNMTHGFSDVALRMMDRRGSLNSRDISLAEPSMTRNHWSLSPPPIPSLSLLLSYSNSGIELSPSLNFMSSFPFICDALPFSISLSNFPCHNRALLLFPTISILPAFPLQPSYFFMAFR